MNWQRGILKIAILILSCGYLIFWSFTIQNLISVFLIDKTFKAILDAFVVFTYPSLIFVAVYFILNKDIGNGSLLIALFLGLYSINKHLNLMVKWSVIESDIQMFISLSFLVTGLAFIKFSQYFPKKISQIEISKIKFPYLLETYLKLLLNSWCFFGIFIPIFCFMLILQYHFGIMNFWIMLNNLIVLLTGILYLYSGYILSSGFIRRKIKWIIYAVFLSLMIVFFTLIISYLEKKGFNIGYSYYVSSFLLQIVLITTWLKLIFFNKKIKKNEFKI